MNRRETVLALAALAAKHRFPLNGAVELAQAGGLMAYGVGFLAQFHRAAYFVDRILKGTKPAALDARPVPEVELRSPL